MIAPLPPSIAGLLAAAETIGKVVLYRSAEIGQSGDETAQPILVLLDNISVAAR